MKQYDVLIIGLGSIGKRHIKILKEIVDCNIYVFRQKSKTKDVIPGAEEYIFNWDDLHDRDIDFAVICNPPIYHVDSAIFLAKKNIPFLVEKPVCASMKKVAQLLGLVEEKKLPVLVGFNLRHHYSYRKIKELIASYDLGKMHSFLAETGQHLPGWRDFDYTQSCSSQKKLGGGVIFDLTHEIDLAIDLLGEVDCICCFKDKVSSLKIDTEDIAEITISHKNRAISHLHLDYLQKEYTRKFKLIFEKGEIFWDYSSGKIKLTLLNECYDFLQPKNYTRDDSFKSQYQHWFNVLNGKEEPLIPLRNGIYISEVALSAHESSEKKKWVKIS